MKRSAGVIPASGPAPNRRAGKRESDATAHGGHYAGYDGIAIYADGTIESEQRSGCLLGASASVTGVPDHAAGYLMIEGPQVTIAAPVAASRILVAHRFAASVNQLAHELSAHARI